MSDGALLVVDDDAVARQLLADALRKDGYDVDAAATGDEAIARGREKCYDVVLTDYNGEDWRRPGVDEIVAATTPQGDRGGIVLLHDGGGDRSQTVRAIERLVPALRARGFTATTSPAARAAGSPRPGAPGRGRGAPRPRSPPDRS